MWHCVSPSHTILRTASHSFSICGRLVYALLSIFRFRNIYQQIGECFHMIPADKNYIRLFLITLIVNSRKALFRLCLSMESRQKSLNTADKRLHVWKESADRRNGEIFMERPIKTVETSKRKSFKALRKVLLVFSSGNRRSNMNMQFFLLYQALEQIKKD